MHDRDYVSLMVRSFQTAIPQVSLTNIQGKPDVTGTLICPGTVRVVVNRREQTALKTVEFD